MPAVEKDGALPLRLLAHLLRSLALHLAGLVFSGDEAAQVRLIRSVWCELSAACASLTSSGIQS